MANKKKIVQFKKIAPKKTKQPTVQTIVKTVEKKTPKKKSFTQSSIGDLIDGAADMLSTLFTGHGKYEVSKNSLMSNLNNTVAPSFETVKDGLRVRHREYIGDVVSSATAGAFQNNVYQVNPGLAQTFPWLSAIAQQFQEYTWEGLIFEYQTESSDALNSVNTALGSVISVVNYRVDLPSNSLPFLSKVQMLDQYWSYDSKPSKSFIVPVECDPKEMPMDVLYIRGTTVPTSEDIKTYDMCNLAVATVGMQGTSVNLGELWVSYDVILRKPQSTSNVAAYQNAAQYYFSAPVNNQPFLGTVAVADSIGLTFPAINQLAFPAGTIGVYVISMYWQSGSSTSIAYPAITYGSGIAPYAAFFSGGTAKQFLLTPGTAISSASMQLSIAYIFDGSSAPGANTLTFGTYTQPAGAVLTMTVGQGPLNNYAQF